MGTCYRPPVRVLCNCADIVRHLVERGRNWFCLGLRLKHIAIESGLVQAVATHTVTCLDRATN
jgi:hypothetical protein